MAAHPSISVSPVTASIGAVVEGVDLSEELSEETIGDLHGALMDHLVLFFHDQDLTDEQHLAFASRFGAPNPYPADARPGEGLLQWIEDTPESPPKADLWHTDVSFIPTPPDIAFLNMRVAAASGGDTLWANLYAVHDLLSPSMQEVMARLRLDVRPVETVTWKGYDGVERVEYRADPMRPSCLQPLVRVHPVTGRRALYMCGSFTFGIDGMYPDESDALLAVLNRRLSDPNVQCRWRWHDHDFAMWDERCTNHRAVADHHPGYRLVRRATVGASVAVGVGG